VYIGGGSTQSNAQVGVNLSGASNQVDSAGLGIASTSVGAGGTALTGNVQNNLNTANYMLMTGAANGGQQVFTFNYQDSTGTHNGVTATVTSSGAAGVSVSDAVTQLNNQLGSMGLTAAVNSAGSLVIGGAQAFALTGAVTTPINGGAVTAGTSLVTDASTAVNSANYNVEAAFAAPTVSNEILSFSNGQVTQFVTLTAGNSGTVGGMASTINAQTAALGIYAVQTAGGGISIQSTGNFTMTMVQPDGPAGTATWSTVAAGSAITVNAPTTTASATGNALAAVTAINNAVSQLGQVQGRVGAGENQLNYAINLAQSQITNFTSAESSIRDANVAAEAANLAQAQVLQQASIAAMAQANSAPQQILALLRT